MPLRDIPVESGKFYHIYNRGVNKQAVFFSDRNYRYFINKLSEYFRPTADILAYCLMPNHFHLMVKVRSDQFLKRSLHPFLISYSKSINLEQGRVGPLFQGRFQANLIDDDQYLVDCTKYIHLNPVKARLVGSPQEWEYSSYKTYLLNRQDTFIDTSQVLGFFDSIKNFVEYTEENMIEYESKNFIED
jgi:REP element-mobilizing transposase RayT